MEHVRLREGGEYLGQRGEDDEVTQLQLLRAENGDSDAQMWVGYVMCVGAVRCG